MKPVPWNMIGRELKVSELKPGTEVVLGKEGRDIHATVSVVIVLDDLVAFQAGIIGLILFRTGPDLESLRDEEAPMHVYEFLGVN